MYSVLADMEIFSLEINESIDKLKAERQAKINKYEIIETLREFENKEKSLLDTADILFKILRK